MSKEFNECLQRYKLPEFDAAWGEIHRGIEKESLRVSTDGDISLSSHPQALGSSSVSYIYLTPPTTYSV